MQERVTRPLGGEVSLPGVGHPLGPEPEVGGRPSGACVARPKE